MTVPDGDLPVNRSNRSAAGATTPVKRVMVVPPSGTVRAQFESTLNGIEAALMKAGVSVISPAVTARVIAEEGTGKPRENAATLSDVERALILAKDAAADAVLQIGVWQWKGTKTRAFCGDKAQDMQPCDDSRWRRTGYHGQIVGRLLHVSDRLIDVRSGEVLTIVDLEQSAADVFPWPVVTRAQVKQSVRLTVVGSTGRRTAPVTLVLK